MTITTTYPGHPAHYPELVSKTNETYPGHPGHYRKKDIARNHDDLLDTLQDFWYGDEDTHRLAANLILDECIADKAFQDKLPSPVIVRLPHWGKTPISNEAPDWDGYVSRYCANC